MRTLRTVAELRAALSSERRHERSIALVPTMGALHDGHLSLIRAARADHDVVVVSLFVNPTQFDEGADLATYPRDEARDARLASGAGADVLFAPSADEVYPTGFATTISVQGPLAETLEGEHRGGGHFAGVGTVVAKLLAMVLPHAAYFGAKDAQQLLVVRRLVRDLDLPVEIVACPTVRDPDGLALSSRNRRLSAAERTSALGLSRALNEVAAGVAAGRYRDRSEAEAAGLAMLDLPQLTVEYFRVVEAITMAPAEKLSGDLLIVAAARAGAVRLIDNKSLSVELSTAAPNNQLVDAEVATLLA